ncbi:MAG: OsmC family protein [Flavobacteriales bacterium]|nr:OsmC family protein [Candidatus Competibacteraceae bacterium]MCZ2442569.1 OsmC family protein [Flavobacteriales bacterium]
MTPHSYPVKLTWVEGRKGHIVSPDLPLEFDVATPPQFDNGIPHIWSPEHLYTAAVLSCFMTTFLAVAGFSKLEFSAFSCDSEGVLDKVEGKFLMTEVKLRPVLTILNEADKEKAEKILHKSEAACLISNSIKTTVTLEPEIRIAP